MRVKQRDEHGEETDERALRFRLAAVFDVSQTDVIPDREPAPLSPPSEPVEGDSHAHLLSPLENFASELGYSVRELALERGAEGGVTQSATRSS